MFIGTSTNQNIICVYDKFVSDKDVLVFSHALVYDFKIDFDDFRITI